MYQLVIRQLLELVPSGLGTLLFWLVLLSVALWIVRHSILVVRTGEVVLVERLGKYCRSLQAGLHLLTPIVEACRRYRWTRNQEDVRTGAVYRAITASFRVSTRVTTYDFPPVNVVTSDQIMVSINGVLWFQVVDAYKAIYAVSDMWDALEQVVMTRLRERASAMTLDEVMQNKGTVQEAVMADLQELALEWGVRVQKLDIQSIDPPKSVLKATQESINARHRAQARLTAERAERDVAVMREKSKRDLARIRAESQRDLTRIQAESDSLKLVQAAESEAKAILTRAEAESERMRMEAEAEAGATAAMVGALGGDSERLVEMERTKSLHALASSPGVRWMPLEALQAIGKLSVWSSLGVGGGGVTTAGAE